MAWLSSLLWPPRGSSIWLEPKRRAGRLCMKGAIECDSQAWHMVFGGAGRSYFGRHDVEEAVSQAAADRRSWSWLQGGKWWGEAPWAHSGRGRLRAAVEGHTHRRSDGAHVSEAIGYRRAEGAEPSRIVRRRAVARTGHAPPKHRGVSRHHGVSPQVEYIRAQAGARIRTSTGPVCDNVGFEGPEPVGKAQHCRHATWTQKPICR